MKKTWIGIGLLAAATTAFAGKPTDGGDSGGTSGSQYGYVGTTSTPIAVGYSTIPSVFDLNDICRVEFGAQARLARSSEIATAIDLNLFLPHQTYRVVMRPEGVAGVGNSNTGNQSVMDRYLPGSFGTQSKWLTVLPSGQFIGMAAPTTSTVEYLVACSTPQ